MAVRLLHDVGPVWIIGGDLRCSSSSYGQILEAWGVLTMYMPICRMKQGQGSDAQKPVLHVFLFSSIMQRDIQTKRQKPENQCTK